MKTLRNMSTAELKAEMGISGNPDKVIGLMEEVFDTVRKVDVTNPGELGNMKFALRRVIAEIELWGEILEKRTGQKYDI